MAIDMVSSSHWLRRSAARRTIDHGRPVRWLSLQGTRQLWKILKAKPLYPELLQNRKEIKAAGNLGTSNIILYHSKIGKPSWLQYVSQRWLSCPGVLVGMQISSLSNRSYSNWTCEPLVLAADYLLIVLENAWHSKTCIGSQTRVSPGKDAGWKLAQLDHLSF